MDEPVQPAGKADTPIPQPPSRLEAIKGFIGDLARPFAIIATSLAASLATVIVAAKSTPDLTGAAVFMGAVFTGVGALYGAKAYEAVVASKQSAIVEVAKANASASTGATP